MKKAFNNNDYIILYDHCKIVEGNDRSIICDFQKEKIKFIPNQMSTIIGQLKNKKLGSVREMYKEESETFNSYIQFLYDENFAFSYKTNEHFKEIEPIWLTPERINNAIIEYSFDTYSIINVLEQLENLLTKFIEIRIKTFSEENIDELVKIFSFEKDTVARSIRLYLPYQTKELAQKVKLALSEFPKIETLIFYGSPANRSVEKESTVTFYITKSFEDITNANINRKFLVNNIHHFFEANHFNPYYNKKVAISASGEIKNCLKNNTSFGNVTKDRIEEIVETETFQELWHASHDKIVDVKDHELRYNFIISNDLIKNKDGLYEIVE